MFHCILNQFLNFKSPNLRQCLTFRHIFVCICWDLKIRIIIRVFFAPPRCLAPSCSFTRRACHSWRFHDVQSHWRQHRTEFFFFSFTFVAPLQWHVYHPFPETQISEGLFLVLDWAQISRGRKHSLSASEVEAFNILLLYNCGNACLFVCLCVTIFFRILHGHQGG